MRTRTRRTRIRTNTGSMIITRTMRWRRTMFVTMSMLIRNIMMLIMLLRMVMFIMIMLMMIMVMTIMMSVVMMVMMKMMHNIFIMESLVSKFAHRRDKSFFQTVATRERRTRRSKGRQSLRRGVIYSAGSARHPVFLYDKPAE